MIERRKHRRYSVYCPIEYKCEDDNPVDSSITINVSEGGALICTHKPIVPQTKVIIKMLLKGEVFFIRAKVVHSELDEDKGTYKIGIQFTENSFSFIRRLYEEIEAIMLYQREYAKQTGEQISLLDASKRWYSSHH
ncbi:MAG: PilZ domain-containing protein [Candidatus Omnitrophica bacterium]|nr:PilZ domain-containing protein [Candidatus Omnitrophota bacterium]